MVLLFGRGAPMFGQEPEQSSNAQRASQRERMREIAESFGVVELSGRFQ
jgi:hypothetical protein